MRRKEKHFSETVSYGWLLRQLEVKQTAEQSCIMTIKTLDGQTAAIFPSKVRLEVWLSEYQQAGT